MIPLAAYLVVGLIVAALWFQAEFGRTVPLRLAPHVCLVVLAWPLVAAGIAVIAAFWTHVWRRSHSRDPEPQPRRRAAPPPSPSFIDGSPEPTTL